MATRFRLPSSGTPDVSPATYGAHTHAGSTRRPLVRADGSALSTVAVTPDASDHSSLGDTFHAQFVSDPLGANVFTTGDAFDFCIQGLEAHTNNNLFIQVFIKIVSNDGSTVLAQLHTHTLDNTELATSLTARYFSGTLSGGYTTTGGERLVVEFSVSGTPGGGGGVQGHNASLRWGSAGAGGDLPENDTETGTTLNPWLEFANTIVFQKPTLDTTVETYWHDPNLGASVAKDAGITLRHLSHMTGCYMRPENPGAAWDYSDYGIGLRENTLKKLLGYSGNMANIDSSTIIDTQFQSVFGSVMQFEDGSGYDVGGFRGNRMFAGSPRDMARLGRLISKRGLWGSTQIIPASWFANPFGGSGSLFGNACVSSSLSRTSGADGSNYLDNPTGALTSVGGGTNQSAIGPGMYGFGLWVNHSNAGSGTPWPGLPSDAMICDGHFGYEVMVIVPQYDIVVAAIGDWGDSTDLGSTSEWNVALGRIAAAVTGTPSYSDETPGTSWNTASDSDAGLSTSELDSFVSEVGTELGVFTRRGRIVRQWGANTFRDWASAAKPITSLILFSLMDAPAAPKSFPPRRKSAAHTFLKAG